MMQMEINWKTPSLYSRLKNTLWRLQETALENISGHVLRGQMVNGSDLIKKNWEKNEHSISIKCTLEPNTTTTPIVWTNLQLRKIYSNTMTKIILIDANSSGSFEKNDLILWPQWTSLTLLERSLILLLLSCLVLMAIIITTY